jgi:hypothetical protein
VRACVRFGEGGGGTEGLMSEGYLQMLLAAGLFAKYVSATYLRTCAVSIQRTVRAAATLAVCCMPRQERRRRPPLRCSA